MGLFIGKGKEDAKNRETNKVIDLDFRNLDLVPNTDFGELDKRSKTQNEIDSDVDYRQIVWNIVNASNEQLDNQNNSKAQLKISFVEFFKPILCVQLALLFIVIFLKGFFTKSFIISDNVLITLISVMFVETLGAIVLMIKYAFDSDQEVKILEILNNVVKDYQKFNTKSDKNETSHSE